MIPFPLACVFTAGGIALAGVVSWLIIRRYKDPKQNELLPTVTTGIVLALIFCCVALVPFDVYSVSSADWKTDSSSVASSGVSNNARFTTAAAEPKRLVGGDTLLASYSSSLNDSSVEMYEPGTVTFVRVLQYVLYGLLILTVFLLVPFAYFYYEEDDLDTTKTKRVLGALKYTAFLLLAMIVLLVIGLFVNTGKTDASEFDTTWFDTLKDSVSTMESIVGFFVACLMLIGFAIYLVYTAYGISALPMSLMVGKQHSMDEMRTLETELDELREKRKKIEAKSDVGMELSKKEEKTLEEISRKERVDEEHIARLKESEGHIQCSAKMRVLLIVLGMVLFLVAGAIVISLFMTLLDTVLHSECGYKCGYILTNPQYTTPLDGVLVILAAMYPLDFVIIGGLAAFILFGTLKGLSNISIRILWIELFKLQPHKTSPQGLLLASLYLALSLMATQQQLMTMAPRYMTYGSQKYVNASGEELFCNVQAPQTECHMTQISRMSYVATGTNQSFIGVILYYGTWLFIIAWVIGFVVSLCKRKANNVSVEEEEIDDAILDGSVPEARRKDGEKDRNNKRDRRGRRRQESEAASRARFHLRGLRSKRKSSTTANDSDVPSATTASSSKNNGSAII